MKKLMLSAAALAVALIGFGSLGASTTLANPAKIWVINANVASAINTGAPVSASAFITAMEGTDVTRAPYLTQLDAFETASAGQVAQTAAIAAFSGQTLIVVQTDGSSSNVTLNGRGLVCASTTTTVSAITAVAITAPYTITTAANHNLMVGNQITISASTTAPSIDGTYTVATTPSLSTLTLTGSPVVTATGTGTITPSGPSSAACDAVATVIPNTVDHIAVYPVVSAGSYAAGATLVVTAQQDAVTLDSRSLTVVGQANNISLVATKTTIQEAAPSCLTTDSITDPARAGAAAIYTDINGNALVGYFTSWASSAVATMKVATPTTPSMLLSDGTTIASGNVICGVAVGSANLTAQNTTPNAITGITGAVTRSQTITVTGVPATVIPSVSPSSIACDGVNSSTVTAKVTDSAGNDVVDNTNVNFSVVALGTANPINAKTKAGEASTIVTPLSGSTAGVTVIVTAGAAGSTAQSSIRVDCSLPVAVPTLPAVVVAPTAPTGAISGPSTGNGGYLAQNGSAGFPLWTLVALALGSVVLVGGGLVTRRAGK